ncbi:hypothetical protein BT93_E2798 [Corymbia citriodora subsp. variegata]|nr:hypothetical protein BT93_E2798 [Corymbia citriodora subsp. variegata]
MNNREVKDQIFDEKKNTVKIKVVGCNPEKVRQEIYCKGRSIICGIDIVPPPPPPPKKENKSTQTKPCTKDAPAQTKQTTQPVLGYPLDVIGRAHVCFSCHKWGCGPFCPCKCHWERPPICDDGCGRPVHDCKCGRSPICQDGCGRPVHKCICKICQDGCGRPVHQCICKRLPICQDGCGRPVHECICRRPPICHDGCGRSVHQCICKRPPICQDGCGRLVHECRCKRPPICHYGCGRPAPECKCWRPICSGRYDHCSNENVSSSWIQHSCDCGRPPVCTNPSYECETSCSLM